MLATWLALAMGAVGGIAGCGSAPQPGAGTIGAQPLQRAVPRWTDAQWSEAVALAWRTTQVEADAAESGGPAAMAGARVVDAPAEARLAAILARLLRAAGTMRDEPPGGDWTARLIRSEALAAWCLAPAGCVVTTALAALPDDELAAALAHALAHALLDHARESADALRDVRARSAAGSAATAYTDTDATALADDIVRIVAATPWRRGQETEADRFGVELAARAGFDPRAAVAFWRRALAEPPLPQAPGWRMRHPAPGNRTTELSRFAQRALPFYEATRGIIRSP